MKASKTKLKKTRGGFNKEGKEQAHGCTLKKQVNKSPYTAKDKTYG
jgi:hypothetical protein